MISKKLNVPANLEGKFHIKVNFAKRDSDPQRENLYEALVIEQI